MEASVKRFLEYKPPGSPPEHRTQNSKKAAGARPHQPTNPLHHYRLDTRTTRPPSGMACSPSPAASRSSGRGPSLPPTRPASGPKAKFTLEDDALLVDLKEKHDMTWKRISEFFPGRSSGTLQVRYCTKLKAKGTAWTEDMTERLKNAIHDYESEKWRIISAKVGHGFSAQACKARAEELETGITE